MRTRWPASVLARRALWTFGIEPLVRWLPKPCSPLRVMALRLMGARIGRGCLLARGVRVLMPWNLALGDGCVLGERVDIYNYAPVSIGPQSMVSQFSYLCTGSHDYDRLDLPLIYSPISIGEQTWLAADVFVGPGVDIADGVVVGARSVVTRSLAEPWVVYVGHPCTKLKARRRPHPASQT